MFSAMQIEAAGRWPDDVAVWRVDCAPALVEGAFFAPGKAAYLDDVERARVLRFRREEDRVRFVLTRSTLRALLAQRLGVPPATLRFDATPQGRPVLCAPPGTRMLSFNVSHSGPHALIAISGVREVGVDVEQYGRVSDWRALCALACTATECEALERAPPAARAQVFVRIWTAKEALLKTLGIGIAQDLQTFSVDPCQREGTGEPRVETLAASGPGVRLRTLRFCWLDELAGSEGCVAWAPRWP
ncbi:4'-phosphopantetheinyl transferase superfamily protein [Paraburkholderia sp. B3]|uniref:4'-phosphopantetheinyl transferase family protein n=1 Tax=Paraburkholderia sp. B3 TaxID=3134791 RepID=UPI0039821A4B